jgi:hypothetical protein
MRSSWVIAGTDPTAAACLARIAFVVMFSAQQILMKPAVGLFFFLKLWAMVNFFFFFLDNSFQALFTAGKRLRWL